MKNQNFEILEIRNTSVLVMDFTGANFTVSKETDKSGVYILNGQLKKQYIKPRSTIKTSSLESFEFYVEYWHGNDTRRKFTKVKAKDTDSAIEKVKRNFKKIVELELC